MDNSSQLTRQRLQLVASDSVITCINMGKYIHTLYVNYPRYNFRVRIRLDN
jgi:hypothetical protein